MSAPFQIYRFNYYGEVTLVSFSSSSSLWIASVRYDTHFRHLAHLSRQRNSIPSGDGAIDGFPMQVG